MATHPGTATTTKRRHPARVRGTQVKHCFKRARISSLYEAALEFNKAFDRHFCKHRPWLLHVTIDPLLRPKSKATN
jgi:hypothetical protein